MFDYRRNDKKDSRNSVFEQSKNITSIALVGLAGYNYLNRLNNELSGVEEARRKILQESRDQRESLKPLIPSPGDVEPEHTDPDIINPGMIDDFIDDNENYNMPGSEDFIEATETDWLKDSDPVIEHYINNTPITPEELAKSMIGSSKNLVDFDKQYESLMGILAKNDMRVLHVKKTMNINQRTFDVLIQNKVTEKVVKISLPQYDLGSIKQGTKSWIYRPTAVLLNNGLNNGIYKYRFDAAFLNTFNDMLKNMEKDLRVGGIDKASLIKRYVHNSLNLLYQSEGVSLEQNEAKGILGTMFIRGDSIEHLGKPFMQKHRRGLLGKNVSWEGAPIYDITPSRKTVNTGFISSVTGVSETALTTSAAGASEPVVGYGPAGEYHKQTSFRQNIQRGRRIRAEENLSRSRWAVKFGTISSTYIDKYVGKEVEDYTGRMANVGFYWNNGKRIFDGSMAFIEQVTDGKLNRMDFSGEVTKGYNVKFIEKGSNLVHKDIQNRIQRFSKGEEIIVKKGQLIGFSPADNKPVYAEESGKITNIIQENNGQRVKFEVTKPSYIGRGTKELYTKEMINFERNSSNMNDLFMAPDQKLAESISRVKGKMGIEFLLNGTSSKRFANGGIGMGFIHKILGDVAELKRQTLMNKSKTNELNIIKAKGEMRTFARDFLKYQLGDNIANSVKAIHVDDTFNVGIELNDGISMAGPQFNRLTDIETLINDAKLTNNWDLFAKKMKEVETFINKKAGLMDYRVVTYVDDMYESMKTNPSHVSAFVMRGNSAHNPGQLVFANLRLLMATHSASDVDNSTTATFKRYAKGFVGGTKLTAEMQRNYEMIGLKHISSYMDTLLDHNLNYIQNKYKSPEHLLLDSKVTANAGNIITLGKRELNVKVAEFLVNNPDDILGRIQQNIIVDDAQGIYKKFRFVRDGSRNVEGLTNEEISKSLINANLLTSDELISKGKGGIGGNSIGIVESEFMKDLMKQINTQKANEVTYLKLPFEVSFNNQIKGDLVPLINFDRSDSFELLKLDQSSKDASVYKRSYTTFGAMQQEQIRYIRRMGDLIQEYNINKGADSRRDAIKKEVEQNTSLFLSKLRSITKGKSSPFTKAIFETRAPFSAMGYIRGTADIGLNQVGFTTDRLVRIMTGNETRSYRELKGKIHRAESFWETFDKFDADSSFQREGFGRRNIKDIRRLFGTSESQGMIDRLFKDMQNITDLSDDEIKLLDTNIKAIKGQVDNISKTIGVVPLSESIELYKTLQKEALVNLDPIRNKYDVATFHRQRALKVIEGMKNGSLSIMASVERHPTNGPTSGTISQVVIHDPIKDPKAFVNRKIKEAYDSGISDPLSIKAIKESAYDQMESANKHIYQRQESQAMIKGDEDGDFINAVLLSMDKLQEVDNNLIKDMNLNKTQRENLFKQSTWSLIHGSHTKGMSMEAYLNYLERMLVVETEGVGSGKYKPANGLSGAILDVINKADYIDRDVKIHTEDLNEYLKHIDKYVPGKIDDEMKKKINRWRKGIIKSAGEMTGLDTHKSLKVIKDINFMDENKYVEEMNSSTIHAHKISEITHDYHTDDEVMLHNQITRGNKESYLSYKAKRMEESIQRMGEMKLDTPGAYKTGSSIIRLSERWAKNEAQRDFLWRLGTDVITQNTISTKHGTHSYLKFMQNTFSSLESTDSDNILVKKSMIDRLVQGNPDIEVPGHVHDLKRYGFISNVNDNIDMDTYERYLTEREKIGRTLVDAHIKSNHEINKLIKEGIKDEKILNSKHRSIIESELSNLTVNNIRPYEKPGSIDEWMYGGREIDNHALSVNSELKNLKETRSVLKSFGRNMWEDLSVMLKTHKETYEASVFHDQLEKARTKFDAGKGGISLSEILDEYTNSAINRSIIETPASVHRRMAKVASSLTNLEVRGRNSDSLAEFESRKLLHESESRAVRSRIFGSNEGATLFYSGSIIERAEGKVHAPAVKSRAGIKAANREGAIKAAAIFAGIAVGAFIGQGINQFISGSAIPGLDNSPGIGGEYYEHGTIMGKDMEIFSSEKPVRVIPNYNYFNKEMRYFKGVMDIRDSKQTYENNRYTASYKGVVVR